MNIYRLRATALCPANEGRDHYDVEVRSEDTIMAEALLTFFNDYAYKRVYQEDLAAAARVQFVGADVRIVGQHPAGVSVEVA